MQNHSNCNLERRRIIHFIVSPQVTPILFKKTLPAGSNQRQGFNITRGVSLAADMAGAGIDAAKSGGGVVTGAIIEVEIGASSNPALKLTIPSCCADPSRAPV